MSRVLTFAGYRPSSRADDLPWTHARIEESAGSTGPWTTIETISLATLDGGIDVDPVHPQTRRFTTEEATLAEGWYRIVFVDADGDGDAPTTPVSSAVALVDAALVRSLTRNVAYGTLGYPVPADGDPDELDDLVLDAISDIETDTGRIPLSALPSLESFPAGPEAYVRIARRAVALRVAQIAYGGSKGNLGQDASGVQSFSVPGYSETRGSKTATNVGALTNPWPELWALIWRLMTPEKREEWVAAQHGEDVPFLDIIDVDIPGAGLSDPFWGGW